jgi:hypothetical protein
MWQFVGTIFAFLAILLSIFLYLKQRQKKLLSYKVISSTPLLSVGGEIKERVKILFDNEPVEAVSLFVVEVKNSGTSPIVNNDYEHRLKIFFGEKARILSSEIISTDPKNLPASIFIQDGKRVVFESILLNRGDSMTAKVLVSGGADLVVEGRIQGVKEISNRTTENRRTLFDKYVFALVLWVLVFRDASVPLLRRYGASENMVTALALFLVSALMILAFLYLYKRTE